MKICNQCGESYQFGGILWMPNEPEPRGETCFSCSVHNAKLPKGAKVLHVKDSGQ